DPTPHNVDTVEGTHDVSPPPDTLQTSSETVNSTDAVPPSSVDTGTPSTTRGTSANGTSNVPSEADSGTAPAPPMTETTPASPATEPPTTTATTVLETTTSTSPARDSLLVSASATNVKPFQDSVITVTVESPGGAPVSGDPVTFTATGTD